MSLIRLALVSLAVAGALAAGFWMPADRAAAEQAVKPVPSSPRTAAPKGATGALPPIPFMGYPAPRPLPVIQAVYEFAARHPEVLQHVPCFCGCEREGHVGNDDCFVKSRDANGRVTWDPHGYGWAICIDVARDAMQMHNSGASVGAIRAAVEGKYKSRFPSATPAPAPPSAKKPGS